MERADLPLRPNRIAIVGLAFRFPGGEDFWPSLCAGRNLVSTIDPTRWSRDAFYHPRKAAPASAYTIVWCDALSIAHVSATIIGGGGLACLAASSIFNTVNRRLAGATTHGGITILALGLAFPECFGDPYLHVDPRLATLWLGNVSEAASFPTILQNKPHMVLSLYGLIVAGLAAGIYYSIHLHKDARWAWIASVIVLAPLTVMTLWQVRSGIAGNAIAIPLVAAAVVQIHSRRGEREVFLGMGRTALLLLTLGNPLSLIAIGKVTERAINAMSGRERPTEVADGPGTCVGLTDYIALQQLPRGLVAAFIDAGPFILAATSHSVLAAPYHRNFRGAGKTYDIFLSLPEVAARHLAIGEPRQAAFDHRPFRSGQEHGAACDRWAVAENPGAEGRSSPGESSDIRQWLHGSTPPVDPAATIALRAREPGGLLP